MLNRYWQWTNGAAAAAASSLPFGPLRYRAWTSSSGSVAGVTSLPFGPLRYRAWTNGIVITPPPPDTSFGGGMAHPFIVPGNMRALAEDELLLWVISAALASGILKD